MVVCRTLNVSDAGLSLDTAAWFPLGTRLSVTILDPESGYAVEVVGDVVREANAPSWTLGISVLDPSDEWRSFVAGAALRARPGSAKPSKRMRVLVFGDRHRQRGAMALYVTSGWDVLFVTDHDSIADALAHIELDAVVAELDLEDPRLQPIMDSVRSSQPSTRRIVRGAGIARSDLVHRFVDRDAGLDALLDALTADMPAP